MSAGIRVFLLKNMTPKIIVLHHTASSKNTTLRDLENWHKQRWPGFISSLGWHIGYHYVILGSGEIVHTRQDNEIGAHTIPNEGKLGICLMGNMEQEQPTLSQLNSLANLLTGLKSIHRLTNNDIQPHNRYSATLCPGKNLLIWLDNYRRKDLNYLQTMIYELQKKIELLWQALKKITG